MFTGREGSGFLVNVTGVRHSQVHARLDGRSWGLITSQERRWDRMAVKERPPRPTFGARPDNKVVHTYTSVLRSPDGDSSGARCRRAGIMGLGGIDGACALEHLPSLVVQLSNGGDLEASGRNGSLR